MAGSYAPNGMGIQNWKFTAMQNTTILKRVNEAIRQTLLSSPDLSTCYIASVLGINRGTVSRVSKEPSL